MSYNINTYIKNPSHAINVHVVGCGGTGSFLLTRLARLNFALKEMDHPGLHVTAFDDDKVELFNVGRQNFTPSDVGEYKSMNMIEKCNMAYSTNWEAFTYRHDGNVNSNILFVCVDNVKFRKLIQNRGKVGLLKGSNIYNQGLYLFDCGNGKDFGQVILSELYGSTLKDTIDIFPDMMKQDTFKAQKTRGCSFAEKLEEQSLFINDFISAEAVDLFWKMFTEQTLDYQGVVINQKTMKKQPIKI